jgi:hypothetical protein
MRMRMAWPEVRFLIKAPPDAGEFRLGMTAG